MAFPPDKKKKSKPGDDPSKPASGPPQAAPSAPQAPPMPGEGIDPYAAMNGQVSSAPMPPSPVPLPGQAPPMPGGPGAFPMGPGGMGEADGDDNPMLAALLGSAANPNAGVIQRGVGEGDSDGGGGWPDPNGGMAGTTEMGGYPGASLGLGMNAPGASPQPPLPSMGASGPVIPGAGGFPGMLPGDPYATFPGEPDIGFQGAGVGDPQMGLEQMIQMLMLAKAGVGGGLPKSSSGLVPDPPTNTMSGMDFGNGQPSYGMY